jgi:integrase
VIPDHQLGGITAVKAARTDKTAERIVRFLTDDEEKRMREALKARDRELKAEAGQRKRMARRAPYDPSRRWWALRRPPRAAGAGRDEYGLRRGDLLNLRWPNIDLPRRQMTLVIGRPHTRPVSAASPSSLSPSRYPQKRLRCSQSCGSSAPGEYVFTAPSGARMTEVKKSFENVMRRAKIESFRFHDLRHTFASRLVMAGVDLNTVRELMTHADMKMTLVYAHLSPDHKAAALDRAFGGAS